MCRRLFRVNSNSFFTIAVPKADWLASASSVLNNDVASKAIDGEADLNVTNHANFWHSSQSSANSVHWLQVEFQVKTGVFRVVIVDR